MVTPPDSSDASMLFGKTRIAILALLFTNAGESYYLREIVRRTGAGLGPVQRELKSLTEMSIVERYEDGNQVYFRANSKSPIFPEIKSLIIKTVGLADRLQVALKPLESRIQEAFIYGSFATGKEHSDSDIDLMVVGGVSLREVVGAISDVGRSLSRVINPTVMLADDYNEQSRDRNGFVRRVRSGPVILLIGDENDS